MKTIRAKSLCVFFLGLCFCASLSIGAPFFDRLIKLASERYGDEASDRVRQWHSMMNEAEHQSELAKLVRVNDFFNQNIRFSSDSEIWGQSDYWATPLETMGIAQGDCEDFGIAKYITLLKLDIPLEKLRLIYVKAKLATGGQQAHMILAYYSDSNADPLILDNLSTEILPASKRIDLVPVFSFNSAGLWVGNATQPKIKKPETRLSRWREVLTRMQLEGIQ